jgi:DUF1680 family protein
MKARTILALVLIPIAPMIAPAQSRMREDTQMKVPLEALPFNLREVRLLDGPFRERMLRDQDYLLSLDPDRLLHNFRVTAGLPSSAKPLGGWEAPDVELRGHSIGHFLSACALMYSSTGDERLKAKAEAVVAELAKVQQALPSRGFHPGYLSAFPEELFDRVDAGKRVWAPYYTLHKIMAGLLDVHLLSGNQQALDVLVKLADWVKFRVDRLSDEQQQRALDTEFGGMNEVLANLYAVTGNPEHLRVARTFDHRAVFDPLAGGEDRLSGLHANTQIPKVIGAAREYELTGDKRYSDIATFFWRRVAHHRSYVIGGNSDDEAFFPVEHFSKHLGESSTETCNTYNMLKLTRHLFAWAPSAETMDFYERGLYNHILASQDPATAMVTYYVPLKPGAFKTFSTPDNSFWCCVGTGMENHAKYADTIYFRDEQSLYVNLFIASELTWKEKGLVVRQETRFPEEDTTRLTFRSGKPVRLALKVRYPSWARSGMMVTINGEREPVQAKPGSYVAIEREWKDGDTVEIRLPMSLRMEAMPDDPKTVALLYGPVVLAGDLGKEGVDAAQRYGPLTPEMVRARTPEVPVFLGDVKDVLARVKPVSGALLTFRTSGLGRPRDVSLVPFYTIFDRHYTVYWKVYSAAEWETRKAEIAAAEARRTDIERRTVDAVQVGESSSERTHAYRGERADSGVYEGRRYRYSRDGWFSYELKVLPDAPLRLLCIYWGGETRERTFDILVDGEKLATQRLGEDKPGDFFDVAYSIPERLTRGKERVTVQFQAPPKGTAGAVYDVRIVRLAQGAP